MQLVGMGWLDLDDVSQLLIWEINDNYLLFPKIIIIIIMGVVIEFVVTSLWFLGQSLRV